MLWGVPHPQESLRHGSSFRNGRRLAFLTALALLAGCLRSPLREEGDGGADAIGGFDGPVDVGEYAMADLPSQHKCTNAPLEWGPKVTLLLPGIYQAGPRTPVFAPNGEGVISLSEGNTSKALWVARYDAMNGRFLAPERLVACEDCEVSWRSLGVDDQGNALIGWNQRIRSNSNRSVWARRYERVTERWLPPVRLEENLTEAGTPMLTLDAAGDGALLFSASDGKTPQLYSRRFRGASGSWEPAEPLPGKHPFEELHSLVGNRRGNAFVLGKMGRQAGFAKGVAVLDPKTKRWGEPHIFRSNPEARAYDAWLAINHAGDAYVLWIETNGHVREIYLQRYAQDTAGWQPIQTYRFTRTPYLATGTVIVDNRGDLILLYRTLQPEGHQSLTAIRYSASEDRWQAAQEAPFRLRRDPSGGPIRALADGCGGLLVLWQEQEYSEILGRSEYFIHGARFLTATEQWQPLERIPLMSAPFGRIRLVLQPSGKPMLIWTHSGRDGYVLVHRELR